MAEKYEITWQADDGYVGGSAPQHCAIDAYDIDADMSEEDLKNLFWQVVQDDFEQKVSPVSEDEVSFIEWAKEEIANRKDA